MIKKLLLIIITAVILVAPSAASAQNTDAPGQSVSDLRKSPVAQAAQETKEQVKDRVEAFKDRVQTIRDTIKKTVVERIISKITAANARITQKMLSALDKLSTILARVENRAEALSASGANTTALLSAIVAAEDTIDAAIAAVNEQAEKEYSAEITDDTTLRRTIGAMVSSFRQDLSAVHRLVVEAKQAVQNAITEAAKLRGASNDATGSAIIEDEF